MLNAQQICLLSDDITIHTQSNEISEVLNKLQKGAATFQSWCPQNKMTWNIDKTSVMTIDTNKKLSNMQDLSIYIYNIQLFQVTSQNLLGIIIENNLTWNKTYLLLQEYSDSHSFIVCSFVACMYFR